MSSQILNPYIITLSIFILGTVCVALIGLVFIFAYSFWKYKGNTAHKSTKHYLTGLPNRAEMVATLEKIIRDASKDKDASIAFLYIDIDDFNNINSSLGNKIGDVLLLQLSRVISTVSYRYSKYLYQIGSDEFALILNDIGKDANLTIEIAKQIIHSVAQPINIEGYELHSSCAVGICIFPECASDAESLLKNAGAAKDNAKKVGYSSHSLYTQEMSKKANMRTLITGDLREALERNEFYLYYQPMINITDNSVECVEALLRWRHTSLGNITPDIFIPAIEDLGLIHSVGKWVINTACKDISKLQAVGYPDLSVSINISAHQFNKGDIATIVAEAMWESGIAPNKVELELTEAVVMSDTEKSVLMMNVLQTMGVKIAVDDFGTGYSSMNQLTKFPISILKIDRCFIHDIDKNPANLAIVSTMLRMGQQLGFKVVAEGVETKEELEVLRNEGCQIIQGFYFSKPLAMPDLMKYLQDNYLEKSATA